MDKSVARTRAGCNTFIHKLKVPERPIWVHTSPAAHAFGETASSPYPGIDQFPRLMTIKPRGEGLRRCSGGIFPDTTLDGQIEYGGVAGNAPETAGRLYLSLNGLATNLDAEHGGTDTNKRDEARQLGRLNVADVQL